VKFNVVNGVTKPIENPRVPGSIPGPGTTYIKKLIIERCSAFLLPAIWATQTVGLQFQSELFIYPTLIYLNKRKYRKTLLLVAQAKQSAQL